MGLALSQKFFLPCTIWWDKCNSIGVLVCAWVVSVAFLMMLRLSQNKWKYLSDAPWKGRWGKRQSSHWASEFSHKGHPTLQRSIQANNTSNWSLDVDTVLQYLELILPSRQRCRTINTPSNLVKSGLSGSFWATALKDVCKFQQKYSDLFKHHNAKIHPYINPILKICPK